MKRQDWVFAGLCLLLGLFAEVTLMETEIGISYSVFLLGFYLVFFFRFRKASFSHRQIGGLLFLSIWALALSFAVSPIPFFYLINLLVIPLLVVVHTILVTSPAGLTWHSFSFLSFLGEKVKQTIGCGTTETKVVARKFKRSLNDATYQNVKKVGAGLLIAAPILFIVLLLLTSADAQFANLLSALPQYFLQLPTAWVWRIVKVLFLAIAFYCFLKIVTKTPRKYSTTGIAWKRSWDHIIVITVLVIVNLIYLLFTIVQFHYFFSGSLEAGFSYSEYARRGFFELILVTLINYGILLGSLTFMKRHTSFSVKVLLTLLISFSGVMLTSSFMRLLMYEQAYGFTRLRVLAHSFMILLAVLLLYTLVKVWIDRLKLVHFYLLCTLLYYVGLNVIGIDRLIVENNVQRYEQTGKIDVHYLGMLSESAVPGLVALYEEHPDIPALQHILMEKRLAYVKDAEIPWQSYRFSRVEAKQALERMVDQ